MRRIVLTSLSVLLLAACIGEIEPGTMAADALPDPLTLARTGRPNDWLVCPEGRCQAEAGAAAPIFPVPPAALWQAWRSVLTEAPRAGMIAVDETRLLLLAQDRTPVFRFVDTVAVHVLPAADGGSTFAAYSRSEIGYTDFGTNRRRLERWIDAVAAKLRNPG